jgi:hypothetical protein
MVAGESEGARMNFHAGCECEQRADSSIACRAAPKPASHRKLCFCALFPLCAFAHPARAADPNEAVNNPDRFISGLRRYVVMHIMPRTVSPRCGDGLQVFGRIQQRRIRTDRLSGRVDVLQAEGSREIHAAPSYQHPPVGFIWSFLKGQQCREIEQ